MKQIYSKPPLTHKEQLKLMSERGILIDNEDEALQQLRSFSYYRLSAYTHFYKKRKENTFEDKYIAGTSFKEIINLYEFDRTLRIHVMEAIERVEITARAHISYFIAQKYGIFGHYDDTNFHPQFNHEEWTNKLEKEIKRSKDTFIQHYKGKYRDFPNLPIWMCTEIMSFGSLSVFYRGMRNEDKSKISEIYNIHYKTLQNWLHTLTYIRNVCAHHSRLWNRDIAITPPKLKESCWRPPITPTTQHVFYILLILRTLLRASNIEAHWKTKIEDLISSIPDAEKTLPAMGFPREWKNHPKWL